MHLQTHRRQSVFSHQAPLKARALQEVALVFFDPSGRPLERVTFDIKVNG